MKHCPATFLVPRQPNEATPLKTTSKFYDKSPDHYEGFFHTDYAEVNDAHQKRFNRPADPIVGPAYACVQILADAITRAGSLIPSVFFRKDRDPKTQLKRYTDLTFRYIYDPQADAQEHQELMTGVEVSWFDVKQNMSNLLNDFPDPQKHPDFPIPVRTEVARWLDKRLKQRLES